MTFDYLSPFQYPPPAMTKKATWTRKVYGFRLLPSLVREIRHLAADTEKRLNELVEEALRDLLAKYEKGTGKKSSRLPKGS